MSYATLAVTQKATPAPWIPIAAVSIALVPARSAQPAARAWGMLVMSAFDLFRGDLCYKLGLKLPRSVEKEREMWLLFSQAMVYRSTNAAGRLTIFRPHESESMEQK